MLKNFVQTRFIARLFFSVSSLFSLNGHCGTNNPPSEISWRLSAGEVCLRLATPGDMIVGKQFSVSHYGPVTPIAIAYDAITLTPLTIKNPHIGLVVNVHRASSEDVRISKSTLREGQLILKMRDFMPDQVFYLIKNGKIIEHDRLDYKRTGSFALYQFRGKNSADAFRARVAAVEKICNKNDKFNAHVLCSGYVDHIYGGKIHRWWNRIPVLNTILDNYIPILNLKTPSALATSPELERVCQVKGAAQGQAEKLIYPLTKNISEWLNKLQAEKNSHNKTLEAHANIILQELTRLGAIRLTYRGWEPLYDQIRFDTAH